MIDHGIVRSSCRPEPVSIDETSVWIHSGIQEIAESPDDRRAFTGFAYHMVQYSREEFILRQAALAESLSRDITGTQLALCEIYELIL